MRRFVILISGIIALSGNLAVPARSGSAQPQSSFENIKVLTDMSDADIRREMQSWARALGVQCNHCHEGTDYPSDANPKKDVARKMATMLKTINKDFLEGKGSCALCHRGSAIPEPPQ
jgi:hypothetical protein